MRNNLFCHLHVHNEYSLLDGFGTAEAYVKRAKELGFEYLGLTNHGNIDGLIQFQQECDKQGIGPVLGCEAYIVPDAKVKQKGERGGHITLLIKNWTGFKNLCQLLTYGHLEGHYYKPRIDYNSLVNHLEGLVILTGCTKTFFYLQGGDDFLVDLQCKHPDVYLEVMPHMMKEQYELNKMWGEASDLTTMSLVATNDCHYIEESDNEVHDVLLAINTKSLMTDQNRFQFNLKKLFLQTADEMLESFKAQQALTIKQIRMAMRNSIEIAEKCSGFRIEKKTVRLPNVPGIKPGFESQELLSQCEKKLADMFPQGVPQDYKDRLDEEIELIMEKGYGQYFMIVRDIVEFCKREDIMIGPCRGSVGGSLVAYLLSITTIDSIKYNLLFWRFVSEDRIDLPDIDVDFEDRKRDLVKKYLADTYGEDNIAGVSSFIRMESRAVILDVGKKFSIPVPEIMNFSKVIAPWDETKWVTQGREQWGQIKSDLHGAIVSTEEGREFFRKHPKVCEVALKLEGQIKSLGRHAGAMCISADNLRDGQRGNLAIRSDNRVINWEKDNAEYMGLMKLDILGLKTLSVLADIKRRVFKNYGTDLIFHPESNSYFLGNGAGSLPDDEGLSVVCCPFTYEKIPVDDSKIFDYLCEGKTAGVFQFNTPGVTRLCKDLQPRSIDAMAQINSLHRPGTLRSGTVDRFIERKKGARWQGLHPLIDNITKDTYGVIVYQEQVMMLARELAGISWANSDRIRKVIGKSKGAAELGKFRNLFVEGCKAQNTLPEETATKLWQELETFGGYAFTKAHAVGYSVLAYWAVWMKVHYPAEFYCAALTYGSEGWRDQLLKEATLEGFEIMLPKVGVSKAESWEEGNKKLYAPFIIIKGVGQSLAVKAEALRAASKRGFFNIIETQRPTGRLGDLLEAVKAFDKDGMPEDPNSLLEISLPIRDMSAYPKLITFLSARYGAPLEDMISGRVKCPHLFKKARIKPVTGDCQACELRQEASQVVHPSTGLWNVMIAGESAGSDEDRLGKGFVGAAGNRILWPELSKYGLKRIKFHVTNLCKCYPSKSKTPTKEQIKTCTKLWIEKEIQELSPPIILAFGNSWIKYVLGKTGGITELSGKTQWAENIGSWICWCTHPAAVLHNEKQNLLPFQTGIKNFVETLKGMGGIDEILY